MSRGRRRRGAPRRALRSGLPLHEIGEQPQAGSGALFRVELHGENIAARRRAGERHTVDAFAGGQLAAAGLLYAAMYTGLVMRTGLVTRDDLKSVLGRNAA